ncbi:MAG: protein kinase [Lentisphaerae bacterium]|nr:protein kinase [Lentisphaerota bacterium]MBT7844875.1 protein kinase [Lentisphaerota bacterium]
MAMYDPAEETQEAALDEMESSVARNLIPGALCVPPPDETVPDKIDKYPITRFLAHGGMGSVYLGSHPNLDIPVAIKLIKKRYAGKPTYVSRFVREARLASQLNHPNIVRIYDADQDCGTYFMVQEYVEGGNLRDLLRSLPDRKLPVPQALRMARSLARALDAAEGLSIVHGDIKPTNVLLTRSSEPKLADLGLAREFDQQTTFDFEDPPHAAGRSVSGSPAYMSPEQINDPQSMDTRSDIYALGITFYQMVTGKVPFAGSTIREFLHKHVNEEIGDPRDVNPKIPGRVAQIILRMCARDPEARYQNAASLLADLERASLPFWRRNATVLAAVLFVVAVAGVTQLLPQSRDDQLALAEQHLCSGDSAQAIAVLEPITDRSPGDIRAFYGLGLSHLQERNPAGVAHAREHLARLPEGLECAQHLEALEALDRGDLERAEQLVIEWENKAKYRLPFLHTKGMLLLRRRDPDDAALALTEAVQEAALFDFQRFGVFDSLAKLFAAEGKYDKASAVYAQALKGRTGVGSPPPMLHTNYAVSLMNAGKTADAAEPLQIALQIDPKDEMALYLNRKLKRLAEETTSNVTQRTMAMLDDVSKAVAARRGSMDAWSSRPTILTFPPAENETPLPKRLGEEQRLAQEIADEVQRRRALPVVNRDAFEHILREHKVSASELAAGDARVRLGRLFPASVLVQATYRERERARMKLRLVDVATSEIVAVISAEQQADQDDAGFVTAIVDELLEKVRTAYPIQARIATVSKKDCNIDVGSYHGLREGAVLDVYPPEANPRSKALARRPPIARLRVVDVSPFTATAQAEGEPAPALVQGMLVMAPLR